MPMALPIDSATVPAAALAALAVGLDRLFLPWSFPARIVPALAAAAPAAALATLSIKNNINNFNQKIFNFIFFNKSKYIFFILKKISNNSKNIRSFVVNKSINNTFYSSI